MNEFELKKECEREPEMILLRRKQNECIKKGRMVQCANITAQIRAFQEKYIKDYPEGKYIRGAQLYNMMKPDEQVKFMTYIDTIAFCADIIHSSCMEVNDLIGKTLPGARVEMFDALAKFGNEAKKQVYWLDDNVSEDFQNDFADFADELNTMVISFVKNKFLKRHEKK